MTLNASKRLILFLLASAAAAQAAEYETIQGHIDGFSNQINRDVGDVPGNRFWGDLNFKYHNKDQPFEIERKFDFSARVNDQNLTMYSLGEAYLGVKGLFKPHDLYTHSGDQMKVGRQILDWSIIDAHWGLGKLNNRRNFDFFEPGQEGLLGVGYVNRSSSGFVWKVFGSGLYVPELNPGQDIDKKDKTITSRHPWSKPPAPTIQHEGQETPIRFNVDYPQISEVIYRYSIGGSVGFNRNHWSGDVFFMRKPENQMTPKVEAALAGTADAVDVFIEPQFYYHDLYGANLRWRNKDVEANVSGIAVQPNTFPDGGNLDFEFPEIRTEKRREAYMGGGINKINDKYGLGLNYIARLSPYDRVKDSLAEDPRWNRAVNAFLSRTFFRTWSLSGDVKYDMLTTDRLVMLRAGYKVSKELLMTFGVNMIGTPNSGKSYWSPFTNNDAVFGSLRYIF